jgi:hypothetical protein
MTSQGSPYARFARALATGNGSIAWAAATELEHLSVDDVLALVLLLPGDTRYRRAAARALGRLCLETPGIGIEQAQLAASALVALPEPLALQTLDAICQELGLTRAADLARARLDHRARPGGPPRHPGA